MAYFTDLFPFVPDSRLRGLWNAPVPVLDGVDFIAMAHWVGLGPDQDGEVEASFLGAHLPFHFGGFHGVDADGQSWVVMLQVAPAIAGQLAGSRNPYWTLQDGMGRALRYNREARVRYEWGWTRTDLIEVYAAQGVPDQEIPNWNVPDLLLGLLGECCFVPLEQIVAGRSAGCAFPDVEHECEHDVFRDVFAYWTTQGLSLAESGSEQWDHEPEPTEPAEAVNETVGPPWSMNRGWQVEYLEGLTVKQLRRRAKSAGWRKKVVANMKRDDLIRLLSTEPRDEPGVAGHRDVTAPLRRVTLETAYAFMSSDYAVIATWIDDDILHVATCDYGDRTDRMAWGEDIPEAFALFAWMVADRFGADRQRLFEYADQHGSPCVLESTEDPPDGTPHGLSFTLDEGHALAIHRSFGDPWVCRFGDWRSLLMHLLVDRCEGVGARDRVTAVLQAAGVTSVEQDRGYV